MFLPGLVEGLMPIVHAKTSGALEEERRLLYVAVTVAACLSWSPARTPGSQAAAPPGLGRVSSMTCGSAGGPMGKALDALLDLLDLEQIEVGAPRAVDERTQRVFGGQVAGQALVAAGRTVPADRPVLLHAYFIRPGDPTVPLVYLVDQVRDGRSFTTRRVSAVQHGETIFTLSASFHHAEPGPRARRPDAERAAARSLRRAPAGPAGPRARRGRRSVAG